MFSINGNNIQSPEDLAKLPSTEVFELAIIRFLEEWFDESSTIKTGTSGSTGKPKIIGLEKKAMLTSAALTTTFFKLKKQDTALLCLPTNYIAGKLMVLRALYAELNLISVAPSSNPLKQLKTTIDFAAMTPMQVNTVLTENPEKLNLITTLIIGGAPVDTALENKLKSYSTDCYSTFGMTETITHIALKRLNKDAHFNALDTVTFSRTSDNCLIIHAPHLSESTLVTNDIVSLISPTSFIWLGRKDNVINTGGVKIQAEELEQQLSLLLPSNRFFITTVKDQQLGEKIILIIEADDAFDTKSLSFESLTKYSRPKAIYTLAKFKETGTGKVLRGENKAILGLA